MIGIICLFSVGYATFSSNFLVSGKGTIVDVKFEVDSKVPLDNLLFWGQADNKENTDLILKDKSRMNNDGTLNGFNGTDVSGYKDNELIFDGIDDYINIGYSDYDFNNSISYVMYLKVNNIILNSDPAFNYNALFGNWEGNGSGIVIYGDRGFGLEIYDGSKWVTGSVGSEINNSKYYTLIATYDGNEFLFYVDGIEELRLTSSRHTISAMPILIGGNPNVNEVSRYANISLKEAMLYDRALTEDEVKMLTKGFQSKYTK